VEKEKERSKEMPIETETKIPLEPGKAKEVRKKIFAYGGRWREGREGVCFQRNTFLDTPDRRLFKCDRLLRIREVIKDGQLVKATITWKGPRKKEEGVFKERPEIEIEVADPQKAIALLSNLGFSEIVEVFEKKIEHLELGGVKIDLNEVPFLGFFIELEGSKEAIKKVVKKLGLDLSQATPQRYEEILQKRFPDIDLAHFTFAAERGSTSNK